MKSRTAPSPKNIWAMAIIGIILLGFFGKITYEKVDNQRVQDSFLKVEAILERLEMSNELLLRAPGEGAVLVSGEEMSVFFKENTMGWTVQNEKSPLELAPDLTLYLNLAENSKIHFYESEPELAMVQQGKHYLYYKIPKETYQKLAYEYSIRSYLVVEPLMEAIAEGKSTSHQSVNDAPANGTYDSAKIGYETYYFYKKSGKYYVESPYFFIKEISKEVYEEAIAAIPK